MIMRNGGMLSRISMAYGVIKKFEVIVGCCILEKLLQNSIQGGKILYDRG